MGISRRRFLTSTAVAGAALATHAAGAEGVPAQDGQGMMPKPAGFNPNDPALKYDLVIAGGDVLDPSQKLRGKRDIGIKNGQIAAVAPSIPNDRSPQRIDAAGKLVTPGLVDLHTTTVRTSPASGCPPTNWSELLRLQPPFRAVTRAGTPLAVFATGSPPSRAPGCSPSSTSPPLGSLAISALAPARW